MKLRDNPVHEQEAKGNEAKRLVDKAIEELVKALQSGESEALVRYMRAFAAFPKYSFGNVVLIVSQRPDASRVAGYTAWKKLGRYVRKGEKGIIIIAPVVFRRNEDASGEAERTDGRSSVRGFRAARVFDISQTDGEPLPEPEMTSGDPSGLTEKLRGLILSSGIRLLEEDLSSAGGVSRGGEIAIQSGLSPAEEFSVLVHEFTHELLHPLPERRQISKTQKETEAEAVACIVATAAGLEAKTAASDYILFHDGKPETVVQSIERIQQTASMIITSLGLAS